MRIVFRALLAVAGLALAQMNLGAAVAKEVVIGTVNHDGKALREVMEVGGTEGQFKAIRLEVHGSEVEILDLHVIYGNGNPDDFDLRQSFKAGSSSRVIDLPGFKRAIRQVVVTYVPHGPARITVFGIEGAPVAANWEALGCKSVAFNVDKDTIEVGRKDGTFRGLKLTVKQAPIEFFGVRITFGNGARQEIKFNQKVPAGSESSQIDLAGESRGIRKIAMLYRSIPTFKGRAEVCAFGRQG
jgi:hypothetical protein